MKQFFFDTADVSNLKRIWDILKKDIHPGEVRGITCNPAIMNRAGKNTLNEWLEAIRELFDFAQTDLAGCELHIQPPNSRANIDEINKFIDLLINIGLYNSSIKLPPYNNILRDAYKSYRFYGFNVNVTGLSESGTACKLHSLANYASIIPGRMIQNGLEYKGHVAFAVENSGVEIITGALRNYEQVSDCFLLGSLPTIGLKTWDLILENKELDKLLNLDYSTPIEVPEFIPEITEKHTQLSKSFFIEMDSYGAQAFQDLKNI